MILETIDLDLEINNLNLKQIQLNPFRIHMIGESGKLDLEMNNLDLLIINLNL